MAPPPYYVPRNLDVYLAAYHGCLAGMTGDRTVGAATGGTYFNPLCKHALTFAQAFDVVFTPPTVPADSLVIGLITDICEQQFVNKSGAADTTVAQLYPLATHIGVLVAQARQYISPLAPPSATLESPFAKGVFNGANIADFSAAPLAGLNFSPVLAGDVVLIVNQTNPTENGLYTIGTVDVATVSLIRSVGWTVGSQWQEQTEIAIGHHDFVYGNTSWFISRADPTTKVTVGSDPLLFYPRAFSRTATFVNGTVTIPSLPLLGNDANIQITRSSLTGMSGATIDYVATYTVNSEVLGGSLTLNAYAFNEVLGINASEQGIVNVLIANLSPVVNPS
jgi:hypothetical protein